MSKLVRLFLLAMLVFGSTVIAAPAGAVAPDFLPTPGQCDEGTLPSGAQWLICVPSSGWNGDLVVYGHGYVAVTDPVDFYHLDIDDVYLPDLVQTLGYAFATTSYRRNGLVIADGVADMRELVAKFEEWTGLEPEHTYITGVSEGGVVAALSVERSADLFSGGLSLCGPVGDLKRQIDYWGDFRVLFDYFFPDTLPPSPMNIPPAIVNKDTWENVYKPQIDNLVSVNPSAARQLIRTSKAAIDPFDLSTINETTLTLLWYNVFATNDGVAQLGGIPYGNINRIYYGSLNDFKLNSPWPLGVERIRADATAVANLSPSDTSGYVRIPLVTMHTTSDENNPFWHQTLYRKKLSARGSLDYVTQIPIMRYGHCNFTATEVLAAFGLLVQRTTGAELQNVPAQYDVAATMMKFERAQAEFATQSIEQ